MTLDVQAALVPLAHFVRRTSHVLLWALLFFSGFFIGNREVAREQTKNEVLRLQMDSLNKQIELTNKLANARQDTVLEATAQRNNERLRANVFFDSYRECMKARGNP